MVKKNLVSVIINCFNSEDYIEDCIQSVLNQKYPYIEIIIVDNTSTDNTAKIIKKFNNNKIKYFYLENHLKLGAARNLAIKKCKGEFIAFIDSDDLWHEDKLLHQIDLFKDQNIGMVYCNGYKFKDNGWKKILYKKQPPVGSLFKTLFTKYFISLETVVIRSSTLKSLNRLFFENFQIIEEYDLICRLSLITKITYVDKVLAYWRFRENSFTWQNRELIHQERNTMLEMYKNEIKNFDFLYKNEIQFFNKRTLLEEIFYLVQIDKINQAKIKIKKYIFKDIKWTILFLLMHNKYLTKRTMQILGYIY